MREKRERCRAYCVMLGAVLPDRTRLNWNLQIASFKEKVIEGGLV